MVNVLSSILNPYKNPNVIFMLSRNTTFFLVIETRINFGYLFNYVTRFGKPKPPRLEMTNLTS